MLQTQFLNEKYWDGTMTDSNSLAAVQYTKPEMNDVLILANNRDERGNLDGYSIIQLISQGMSGVTYTDKLLGNNEYQWHVDSGQTLRPIPITDVSPTPHNGLAFQEFIVPLQERYFSVGDVVLFADESQARVVREPYMQNSSWCYTMQMMGADGQARVADWALTVGKEVAFAFTAFEEGSEGGGIKAHSTMAFRNQMNTQRMEFGMTGDAKTDKLVFRVKTKNQSSQWWLYKAEYDAMNQWEQAQENALWLSRYNKDRNGLIIHSGVSGRNLSMGAGIEQQISGINELNTSQLTPGLLRPYLLDLEDKCMNRGSSHFMIFCGTGFADHFDTQMRKAVKDLGNYVVNGDYFIHQKEGTKLSFGAQFTTYEGLWNTKFTLVRHKYFDNKRLFTEIDPRTGYTLKSFEGYVINVGNYDGTPNLQMFAKGGDGENRSMKRWVTEGGTTYNSGGASSKAMTDAVMRSNGFDGFKMHFLSQRMVVIHNPFCCGRIRITPAGWR